MKVQNLVAFHKNGKKNPPEQDLCSCFVICAAIFCHIQTTKDLHLLRVKKYSTLIVFHSFFH